MFQSTPAWGGRLAGRRKRRSAILVSIHARVGRATRTRRMYASTGSFNPRPRGAGDHSSEDQYRGTRVFQSTPAWGGRQLRRRTHHPHLGVSIHARVGRATRGCKVRRRWLEVSIHARVGRATREWTRRGRGCWSFNPRPRGAGDTLIDFELTTDTVFQSTPAWGGRHDPLPTGAALREFQSTPAWGGRPLHHDHRMGLQQSFNPRPRGAGDPARRRSSTSSGCFNPRPRGAGRPGSPARSRSPLTVSIHARVGAGDLVEDDPSVVHHVSIHARVGAGDELVVRTGGEYR